MGTILAVRPETRDKFTLAHSQAPATPPVVILNMFYSGLGIARDLARKGVRIIGLSADRRIYGNYTRCCEVRMAPDSQARPEQLYEALVSLASEIGSAVIFPTRDADVLFLDRFREDLATHYILAIPPRSQLMQAMDKHALAIEAQRAGIPTPRTIVISSREDLPRVGVEVGFPCVLKPVFAVDWRVAGSWKRVGARKAIRVANAEELEREYEMISSLGHDVLAQQWIEGGADRITVLGGYVQQGGRIAQYFTARKLVQSPDDCGTGCVVESVQIPEMIDLSSRLCKALQYQGMAEIEYKYDASTGRFLLIEINTRHWDWHGLGAASGVNLSWAAYRDLTGRPIDQQPAQISTAKWIAEDALLVYVLRGLYRRNLRVRDLWRRLSGRRIYGIFAWKDLRPGLRWSLFQFLPELVKSMARSVGGGSLG